MVKQILAFRLMVILLTSLGIGVTASAQCGLCQFPVQLVTNGNFSSGNTGFTTSLNLGSGFFCPLCPEGTYAVGVNAIFFHSDFLGTDHTNPPTGNFFIANGAGLSTSEVWCQTITVQPQTDYTFSFWGRDITNNPNPHPLALLHASFNGEWIGDSLICSGGWQSYTVQWNSQDLTSVEICIVNTQSQGGGNDFGLDDVSLTGCHNYMLSQEAELGTDLTICGSETVTGIGLPAIPGYSYLWSNAAGLSSQSISNPSYSLPNSGPDPITETIVLTIDSAGVGCVTSDTLLITVNPIPPFDLGQDHVLCPGESVTLDAGDGWESILWSDGSSGQTLEGIGTGSISAEVAYFNCTASDDVEITLVNLPNLNFADTESLCEGDEITLQAGVSGQWQDGSFSDFYVVTSSGNYVFTHTLSGCSVSDSTLVEIIAYPVLVLEGPEFICEGSTATLTSGIAAIWITGETAESIEVDEPGTYSAFADNQGCLSTASIAIGWQALPVVVLPADTSFCDSRWLYLEVLETDGTTYIWSTGDSTSMIRVTEAGEYVVTATNICGTISAEVVADTYTCDWGLYIPTSVTPNGDGLNESWEVIGRNISNVEVTVYNRFGDQIFFTKTLEPWIPRDLMGDDAYTYLVKAIDFQGQPIRRTGFIAVLR